MLPHRPRIADRSAVFLKLYRLLNVIRAIPCGFDVSSDFPLVPSITEHIDDIDNRKIIAIKAINPAIFSPPFCFNFSPAFSFLLRFTSRLSFLLVLLIFSKHFLFSLFWLHATTPAAFSSSFILYHSRYRFRCSKSGTDTSSPTSTFCKVSII